jgi:hypothetical protein
MTMLNSDVDQSFVGETSTFGFHTESSTSNSDVEIAEKITEGLQPPSPSQSSAQFPTIPPHLPPPPLSTLKRAHSDTQDTPTPTKKSCC